MTIQKMLKAHYANYECYKKSISASSQDGISSDDEIIEIFAQKSVLKSSLKLFSVLTHVLTQE